MTEPSGPELSGFLKSEAAAQGFEAAGIARIERSDHGAFYEAWLADGLHGDMHYLARPDAVARRLDPRRTIPDLKSALVVAHMYGDGGAEASDASTGIIARYARGRDYHRVIRKKLLAVLAGLEAKLGRELPLARACVDTAPVLERELARRAGLGWFGRNTMILHPRRGSYFFLGVLLLELDLPADAPFTADRCGTCNACVDACPTGALLGRDNTGAPVMDARRCISYLTIEHRGPIPLELRPLIGNRIFGCDICQEVCPWNAGKFVQLTGERDYRAEWREAPDRPGAPGALPTTTSPSLVELMRMTHDEWEQWTRGSAMRRAGYGGFRRNVAVAIGNWLASVESPPAQAVAVLRDAARDNDALVREHARWALERAGETGIVH